MPTLKAKLTGYAFVMKANGMPRIDNPKDVPQEAWDTLTKEQKAYANNQVDVPFQRQL